MHHMRKIMCFLKIKVCTSIRPGPQNKSMNLKIIILYIILFKMVTCWLWVYIQHTLVWSFSILFLTALCPACFSCMSAKCPQWNHVLDVSLSKYTCFKWSACHQALLRPDNNPFIWIRCLSQEKKNMHHWAHSSDKNIINAEPFTWHI